MGKGLRPLRARASGCRVRSVFFFNFFLGGVDGSVLVLRQDDTRGDDDLRG